ncbi:MAG: thiosulfate oxidation carrier protein SoxY [Candidatus Tectomicrobia bacterium]|nr:thiosulfate oxidation carrier protein SoxY [Candidatus Tectomicrobia bacterium]
MNLVRRKVIQGGMMAGLATLVGVPKLLLAAWPKDAFKAKSMEDALAALTGTAEAQDGEIVIKAPEIAENGAVVPVSVTSHIANTESIAIIVPNNPQPLAASFELMGGEPFVSVRIKMAQTSDVVAVVKSGGQVYQGRKEVKVTIGGCGG